MTKHFLLLPLLLLCLNHSLLFSYENETNETIEEYAEHQRNAPRIDTAQWHPVFRGLLGASYALLSNSVVMGVSVIVEQSGGGWDWATPSFRSWRMNLTEPWKWDDDGFIVNQFGHPMQGSSYFSAGRVTGFGFYQSIFFNIFGSLTWEAFFENQTASISDVFTTVPSGISLGEMFYRLYAQAIAAGVPAPLAFFINPVAGVHRLITGWHPPDYGSSFHNLEFRLGTGHARVHSNVAGMPEFSFGGDFGSPAGGFFGDVGVNIVYNNPFEQESRIPFNHFQFDLSIAFGGPDFMDLSFFSDGYLFSFAPVFTSTSRMSTGLSLHLDMAAIGAQGFLTSSTVNMFSNALNWTIKYQRLFRDGSDFQLKAHAGVTFFGVSVFYCPVVMEDLNNFGSGVNSKLFLAFNHPRFGALRASVFGYTIWSYPGITAINRGTVFWLFNDVTYLFPITERISLGATHSIALERGWFSNFSDIRKMSRSAQLFVAWNF